MTEVPVDGGPAALAALAAAGASGSNLYDMGAVLQPSKASASTPGAPCSS